MPTVTLAPPDPAAATTTKILTALSEGHAGNYAVKLWTGETWPWGRGPAPFTLVLKHPGALRAMLWPFDRVGLGEAYIFDDFDIEGDIFAFTELLRHIVRLSESRSFWSKLRLLRALWRLPRRKNPRDLSKAGRPVGGDHSKANDREAISFAYDLPGDFYKLFLDRNMQYTCAYFRSAGDALDAAQLGKLDHICKKLRLKPGERFLDVGCGWGGLVIHAAKHYGVQATGVTLAGEQAKWCERAIDEAGVRDRVRIVYSDYRDFHDPAGFDKASAVGIGEHIGVANVPLFFRKVYENLRPGGAFLNHGIFLRPHTPYPRWTPFARKYVFPNGELHTILRSLEGAAAAGFEVRDLENLREHYILTLEHWVRNLEANREEVLKVVGDVSYRVFRIYMAGATLGFKTGTYALNQVLLSKPADGAARMPLTRHDWY